MTQKIEDTVTAWETGTLGRDAAFTQPVTAEEQAADQAAIDAAFDLKPISIRMEVEVLDSLKAIARHRGIGYQPLIRQVLHRWVDSELKQIALEAIDLRDEDEIKVSSEMKKAA